MTRVKHFWRHLLGFIVIGCFTLQAAGWHVIPLAQRVEWILHDLRVLLIAPQSKDDRIVIVDIDEKSLLPTERGGEGHWPWPRNRLAQLITTLVETHGAAVVGLDIILSESDRSSGLQVLEQLAREQLRYNQPFQEQMAVLRPLLSHDQLLARTMSGKPVILGYAFHNDKPSSSAILPGGFDPMAWGVDNPVAHSYPGYTGVLPELGAAASGSGHINPLRDADGVIRRVPMLIEYAGKYYPSLSLSVVQQLLGEDKLTVTASRYGVDDMRLEKLHVGPVSVPVDRALNAVVPFRGQARSFPYVSAADVLQGRVERGKLENKIVIVGTSAAGLSDLVATPVGVGIPGAEIHANLISATLDDRIPQTPAWATGADILSVLALGCVLLFLGGSKGPVFSMVLFGFCSFALVGINVFALSAYHLLLPLATALMSLVSLFILNMSYGFLFESRGKRQMSALFAHYVPPELVEKMAENPQAYSMRPVERELTVLFADIRNFTSISERLTPQELGELMDAVLGAQSQVIRNEFQGTLDKYIGDAVMAFWGAPVTDPDHARHAIEAAIAMLQAVRQVDADARKKGWPPIHIGVGINTGKVHVGDMGSKVRQAYTALGDPVNLASRLEGLTKVYGVDLLVGESTRQSVADWVFREVDKVQVKGKEQAVTIFEPIGPVGSLPVALQQELDAWSDALLAYRSREWGKTSELLEDLVKKYPGRRLYAHYLLRVADFQSQEPPATWNGTTRLTA